MNIPSMTQPERASKCRTAGAGHHASKYPAEMVQQARELRQMQRWSVQRIANKLGVPYGTVQDWCSYRNRRVS